MYRLQRARKAVVVGIQDRGFGNFVHNMIKLSVNKTKWPGLLARTHLSFESGTLEKPSPDTKISVTNFVYLY